MSTALGLLGVAALILANGYFVAAEFGYVATRRSRIEDLAERGDRRAGHAVGILQRLSFMLSGAQLGITATSLLVGFVGESTIGAALLPLVELLGLSDTAARSLTLSLGFALATSAQMVFGELAPKNYAIAKPESTSLSLARSLRLFLTVAGPVISFFDRSANALVRAVGIEPTEELQEGVTAQELEVIIAESERSGDLSDREAELLGRVLDFRERRAAAVMVPRPKVMTIDADATCEDLRQLAIRTGHSRFPVVGPGGIDECQGVVGALTIFSVPVEERPERGIRGLTVPPVAVPETITLVSLLAELRSAQAQLALVIDEFGGVAGIATLEDIVEELVGEIRDEHDRPEPAVRPHDDGGWVVPGSWRLDETTRDTGIELPEGEYETIGGLVMERLGRIPEVGDEVHEDDVRVAVVQMSGRAVGTVHIRTEEPDTDADDAQDADEAADRAAEGAA